VHPGCLPATRGHRCDPGLCGQGRGGGIACAWRTAGAPEARRAAGARAWEGRAERAVGRAWRPRREGGGAGGARRQRHAAGGHAGLDAEGLGRPPAVSRGAGDGGCDGLARWGHDRRRPDVLVPKAGGAGRTAGPRRGLARRPAAEAVAAQRGSWGLDPWPQGGTSVLQRPGPAGGEPAVGAPHPATGVDAWGARPPRRARRREGWPLSGGCAAAFAREGGGRRGIVRPAGGEGWAVPGQGEGSAGAEDPNVRRAPGGAQRAWVACTADGHGWAVEPRAQPAPPGVARRGRRFEAEARMCRGARRVSAPSRCGLGPVETDERRAGLVRSVVPG
jgi:hypothetical protein